MPRMWMVDPNTMCDKHLIAEHHETHVFAGRIRKRMPLDGWLAKNMLEPAALQARHDDLADEMVLRGFNHDSMLVICPEDYLSADQLAVRIDRNTAEVELHSRCAACKEKSLKV